MVTGRLGSSASASQTAEETPLTLLHLSPRAEFQPAANHFLHSANTTTVDRLTPEPHSLSRPLDFRRSVVLESFASLSFSFSFTTLRPAANALTHSTSLRLFLLLIYPFIGFFIHHPSPSLSHPVFLNLSLPVCLT